MVIMIPESTVHWYFSATCITAPIFGGLLSGVVGNKIGGHESKYAVPSCLLAGSLCVACAIILPLCNEAHKVVGLIWMIIFAGGYILPFVTGIMLCQIEP